MRNLFKLVANGINYMADVQQTLLELGFKHALMSGPTVVAFGRDLLDAVQNSGLNDAIKNFNTAWEPSAEQLKEMATAYDGAEKLFGDIENAFNNLGKTPNKKRSRASEMN